MLVYCCIIRKNRFIYKKMNNLKNKTILISFIFFLFPLLSNAKEPAQIDQGPHIHINSTYEIPQKVVDRLLKVYEKHDIHPKERSWQIDDWIRRYKELVSLIKKRASNDKLADEALAHLYAGSLGGVEGVLKAMMQSASQGGGKEGRSVAIAYELGILKELQFNHKEAILFYEQALELEPKNLEYLSKLGYAYYRLGEYEKAMSFYRTALGVAKKVYGENSPKAANQFNNLGEAWFRLGSTNRAMRNYEEALRIDKAAFGKKHSRLIRKLSNLGDAWYKAGEYKQAVAYHNKALKSAKEAYGDGHPSLLVHLFNLGEDWHVPGAGTERLFDIMSRLWRLKETLTARGNLHWFFI